MTKRDCVAVVDVPNRDANHVGLEPASGVACDRYRIPGKTKIQKLDGVSRCIERGCHTCEPVWYDRVGLALAIGAHQQHSRAVLRRKPGRGHRPTSVKSCTMSLKLSG